ncbi:MAG: hypothetical protein ACYTAS_06240 [Planctomycetota bacterium]|jgi:hypothetical protein
MNVKRILIVSVVVLASTVVLTGCATEQSPVAGVITESNRLPVGRRAPDFPVVTAEGKEIRFSEVREPTTIMAFVSPTGDQCCWLKPELVSLAEELRNYRIGVAQISEPTDKCPHGPGCVATCKLQDPHLISLCDAERRAWVAYRKPEPNTVVLVNYRGEVEHVAPLTELETIVKKARHLAAEFEGWWQSAYEG